MLKSLLRLQQVDAGVRIENVMTMSADLPLGHLSRRRARDALHRAGSRTSSAPSPAWSRPRSRRTCRCSASGRAKRSRHPAAAQSIPTRFKRVDPNYFATLDIPVLAGRGFSPRDRAGAPRVAIVNDTLARRLAERFGVTDSARIIGRAVSLPRPLYENRGQAGGREDAVIVGVIRDERVNDLEAPMPDVVYVRAAAVSRAARSS